MSKYRPVDVRIWNDRKVASLSLNAKLLWAFLLTAPSTLPIPGVVIGGPAALSEQLGMSVELFEQLFDELLRKQLSVRREGRLIWLPNALKYQPPRNPNMLKSWASVWDDIPEGALKMEIWQALETACKKFQAAFHRLFPRLFGGLLPPLLDRLLPEQKHQEQEQEQEQAETHSPARAIPPTAVPAAVPSTIGIQTPIEARQALRAELIGELNESRQAAAAELGVEHRPLLAHDPGERALAMMLMGADLERVAADARHAIRVAHTEAIRDRSLKWLTGAVFEERNFRRLVGSSVEEASRQRDGPKQTRSTGRAEPKRPEDYREGDQKL